MPTWMKWAISFLIGGAFIYVGWRWWNPLLVGLHVMVCITLILVVLLQSGKAADLAGAFGGAGSQTAFGPRGAATFLSQATTWCAIMFMVTSVTLTVRQTRLGPATGNSVLEGTAPAPAPAPVTPAPTQQPPPASQQTPAPTGQQPPAQNPPAQTPPAQPKQ